MMLFYMYQKIYTHIQKKQAVSVRLKFFDFPSAFNTKQPQSLVQKLLNTKLPSSLIPWIFDYLTIRLQYVRPNGVLSSVICTNIGAPKGTDLAPFLFSLYTADCRSTTESCPSVKFADDTELVGNISMTRMRYTTNRLKTL